MDLTNENLTYAEIKELLKDNVTKNMDIFPNAQVSLQLASMVNYKPILFPIIKQVATKGIVEIGGYHGNHLKELNQLTIGTPLKLHSVDPANKMLPESHDKLFSNVEFFGNKSFDYLNLTNSFECDVFIIDGDHNYETVSYELDTILNRDSVNLVILHDTAWPCSSIDTFYDKDDVVNKKVAESGYMQLQKNNSDLKLPFFFPIDFDVATEQCDEIASSKTGVSGAVDEFLVKYPDWKSQSIASIFGLTILYRSRLNENLKFKQLIEYLSYMKSFLDILELNRIMLISHTHQQGIEWGENQQEIKRLQQIVCEKEAQIKEIKDENDRLNVKL